MNENYPPLCLCNVLVNAPFHYYQDIFMGEDLDRDQDISKWYDERSGDDICWTCPICQSMNFMIPLKNIVLCFMYGDRNLSENNFKII